jgi:hypothetical protein
MRYKFTFFQLRKITKRKIHIFVLKSSKNHFVLMGFQQNRVAIEVFREHGIHFYIKNNNFIIQNLNFGKDC